MNNKKTSSGFAFCHMMLQSTKWSNTLEKLIINHWILNYYYFKKSQPSAFIGIKTLGFFIKFVEPVLCFSSSLVCCKVLWNKWKNNREKHCPPTFSAALVFKVFFLTGISKKFLLKSHEPNQPATRCPTRFPRSITNDNDLKMMAIHNMLKPTFACKNISTSVVAWFTNKSFLWDHFVNESIKKTHTLLV